MKRIVNRVAAAPQMRNAGLLSPVSYGGTTTYQQPWDRIRGIKQGHDRETIVAALTSAIAADASNVDELPIVAEQLGTGEDVTEDSHYCYALNVAATSAMSAVTFRRHLVDAINYAGEAYILEVNGTLTPLVGGHVEILPAGMGSTLPDGSPMLVAGYQVRDDAGQLRGTYDGQGRATGGGAIAGSTLHRAYIPHPENPLRASAPIQAAGMPIDVLHFQRQATKSILVNDGMPAGVLSIQPPFEGAELAQEEIEDAEQRINRKAADGTRKGRVMVLNASASYQPLGVPALGDGWVRIAENARAEILAVWRAPESVLGRGGARTYENQRVELAAYYEATVMPILNLVCAALNLTARRMGYRLLIDTSRIPALNESQDEIALRASQLRAAGMITLNEARHLIGLEPLDGGDELPGTQRPTADQPPGNPLNDPERSAAAVMPPFLRRAAGPDPDRFSARIDDAVAPYEELLAVYAQKFHSRIYRMVEGGLRRRVGMTRSDTADIPVPPVDASVIIDTAARSAELAEDLLPMFETATEAVGVVVLDELGGELTPTTMATWQQTAGDLVQRIVDGTSERPGWAASLVADIQEAINEAYLLGESIDGAMARVADALTASGASTQEVAARAERIARTELSSLMNRVAYDQMVESEVVSHKRWYSIGDNRSRDSHRELNGTMVRLDEKFLVGGVPADGPHDPALPASQIVNCRCRLIPVVGD